MSLLREITRAVDPALEPHARADPPPGRYEGRLPDGVREFVFESVREGFACHYGEPAAFDEMDSDMRLLAGDALYALGVSRLAEAGDLEAVAELAQLIARSAQAVADDRHHVIETLWSRSLAALGGGEQQSASSDAAGS